MNKQCGFYTLIKSPKIKKISFGHDVMLLRMAIYVASEKFTFVQSDE